MQHIPAFTFHYIPVLRAPQAEIFRFDLDSACMKVIGMAHTKKSVVQIKTNFAENAYISELLLINLQLKF